MSKIKAIDFANYVESTNKLLENTLIKNDIIPSKTLLGKATQIEQLSIKKDKYIPDPYFDKMEQLYDNDPLRIENGGEYAFCTYVVLLKKYDTAYIPSITRTSNGIIVTSDGQTLDFTNTAITITFNDTNTDENKLQTGEYVRWLKIYCVTKHPDFLAFPCLPEGSSSTSDFSLGQTVFHIGNSGNFWNYSTNSLTTYGLSLRYLIYDNKTDLSNQNNNLEYAYNLECIKFKNNIDTLKVSNQTSNQGMFLGCISLHYTNANINSLTFSSSNYIRAHNLILDFSKTNIQANEISVFAKNIILPKDYSFTIIALYTTDITTFIPKSNNISSLKIFCDYKNYVSRHLIFEDDWDLNLTITITTGNTGYYVAGLNIISIIELISKLHNFSNTNETRTLSIPTKFLEQLAPNLIEEANNKGWTISAN